MFELPHHAIVVPFRHTFRIANGALDKRLQATLEQLVHLVVVVIVVPDAEHTLNVVPDRSSETGRVHLAVRAHCVVGEVVGCLELIVEEIADVVVETIHQRVAMIVPGVVLHPERWYVVQLTTLKTRNRLSMVGFIQAYVYDTYRRVLVLGDNAGIEIFRFFKSET